MCLGELVLTVTVLARSEYIMCILCFVNAAVCCCIHVCSGTGEISQRKRRKRAKTTELKQLFSKNYFNSPGRFKCALGLPLLYRSRPEELKRHALRVTYNVLV